MAMLSKIDPWWVLALSLVLGGISIALGNGLFPYLKEQKELNEKRTIEEAEKEARLNAVKNILADEVLRNIRLSHKIACSLQQGLIKISPLESTALDAVVSSGSAQTLNSDLFKKLLNAAYSLKQAQEMHNRLSQLMLNPTPQGLQQRQGLEQELMPYLIATRTQLIELFREYGLEQDLTYPEEAQVLRQELAGQGVQL